MYYLTLLDAYVASWSLLLIAFVECVVVGWVYGADQLLENLKWMIGFYPPVYLFWMLAWKLLTPLVLLVSSREAETV